MPPKRIMSVLQLKITPDDGDVVKLEDEQLLVQVSPTTERVMTWMPAHTPTVATPRVMSPTPGTSEGVQPPKRARRRKKKNVEQLLAFDGSDDDDEAASSDSDGDAHDIIDMTNIREVARRLRSYEVLLDDGEEEEADRMLEAGLGDMQIVEEDAQGTTLAEQDSEGVGRGFEPRAMDENTSRAVNNAKDEKDQMYTFDWSEDFGTFSGQPEVYARSPGPNIDCTDVLDIFSSIWDETILGKIVKETNRYAKQSIAALVSSKGELPNYLAKWAPTSIEEIRRLFVVYIYMSLNHRARIDEYWTLGVLGMPDFRRIMSRNRFRLLTKFIHFVDNREIPSTASIYQKRIAKISPVHDYIMQKFTELYTPRRELSLDETLLLWKGRLSWAQCIRTKAARFGIKSFELCEANSGYLLKSIMYAGRDSSHVEGPIHGFSNKTAKVVLELMDSFLDVGHLVVMDDWYNQLCLTKFLKTRHTDVLGTLNKNRASVPAAIKYADGRLMRRGQQIARHCGDISVIAWKDVKLVTLISTFHSDEQVPGTRGNVAFMKPVVVDAYNKSMGGVDTKDQKLTAYPMERTRGKKWYMKVFMRLHNVSILNSYIIHSKLTKNSLSHRKFRYNLAESLLRCSRRPDPRPVFPHFNPNNEVRLDRQPDHFVVPTPTRQGKETQHTRRRCARCSARHLRRQTTLMCRKCNIPLCPGPCWIEYHTLMKLGPKL